MKLFRKRKQRIDGDELRFNSMVNAVKDLPRADYNRYKKAMDLSYDAYQTIKNVKTEEEKGNQDIAEAESTLDFIETKENKK